jgi:hypothetical protein
MHFMDDGNQPMVFDDRKRQICKAGTAAWVRLKKKKAWIDWLTVGEALRIGREEAMRRAGVNRPEGKGYNMAFGKWLADYKLDDMDKADRSRLFNVMDEIGRIEEWRKTLTTTERLRLNHPSTVWRKWKATQEPARLGSDGEPKTTLRDSVASLSEEMHVRDREIAQLKEHITDLDSARDDTLLKEACEALSRCFRALGYQNDNTEVFRGVLSSDELFDLWLKRHHERNGSTGSFNTQ